MSVTGQVADLTVTPYTVTIVDDDTRRVDVTPTSLAFDEGASEQYEVLLESQPTATVTIGISVTGDSDITVSTPSLSFTTDDWSAAKTVTVYAAQDDDSAPDTATIAHTVSGGDYGSHGVTAQSVSVNVTDTYSPPTVPGAPTNLSATSDSATVVTLTWQAPTDTGGSGIVITGYRIEYSAPGYLDSADTDRWALLDSDTGSDSTTHSHVHQIGPDVRLQYRVSAINSEGTGDSSNIAETTTPSASDVDGNAAPSPTRITANGIAIEITLDENLDSGSEPDPAQFTVSIGAADRTPTDVDISGSTVQLTLSSVDAVEAGDVVYVSYTRTQQQIGDAVVPLAANTLQDGEGNLVASWTRMLAENLTPDDSDARLRSLSLSHGTLTPTFSSDVKDYSATVDRIVTAVTVTPVPIDADATFEFLDSVSDPIPDADSASGQQVALTHGSNAIYIAVTAADGQTKETYSVTVTRENNVGVSVTPTEISVHEGESGKYEVVLDAPPTANVEIDIDAEPDVTVEPDNLMFTPDNWNSKKEVTVTTNQDDNSHNEMVMVEHGVSTTDADYARADVKSVMVEVMDDDIPGLTLSDYKLRIAEGGSTTYTVVLDIEPSYDVIVGIFTHPLWDEGFRAEPANPVSAPPDFVLLDFPVLGPYSYIRFTPDNWNIPQTITLYGPAADEDGVEVTGTIHHVIASSEDTGYGALAREAESLGTLCAVSIDAFAETGTPRVVISTDALSVPEGGIERYTIGMSGDFSGLISIGISSSDPSVTVDPSVVQFNYGNWDHKRHVKVLASQGANDATLTHTFNEEDTSADVQSTLGTVEVTIEGSKFLSIADAEANENDGYMRFEVRLSSMSVGTVSVDYATSNGTATAGSDYEAKTGTITFQNYEEVRLVKVPLIGDSINDDGETFTVTLSNPVGAVIDDGQATGTIRNSDPLPQAWLARFGRLASDHAIDAISARLTNEREMASQGFLGFESGPHAGPQPTSNASKESLERQSISPWGRVTTTRINSGQDGVAIDGSVTSIVLGVDTRLNRWQTGLALAHASGQGSYRAGISSDETGTLDSSLSSLHPYISFDVNERVVAWSVLGYGVGELTLAQSGSTGRWSPKTAMHMAALGMQGVLLTGSDGLRLTTRLDGRTMQMTSDAVSTPLGNLAASAAETRRLRLLLEGSRTLTIGRDRQLTPSLEVAIRHDGGDAEQGTGVDVTGAFRFADSSAGLTIDAHAHRLLMHDDADYDEWGAGLAFQYDPDASRRGLSIGLAPSWSSAPPGASWHVRPLHREPMFGFGERIEPGARIEADISYGLPAFGGRGTMAPFASVESTMSRSRVWHTGIRWWLGQDFTIQVEGIRRERDGVDEPSHEFVLGARATQ